MTPVIELHDVHKTYGELTALDGIDLRVHGGEIVAVLGPNGAGKTTTFELLLGLIRPTRGRVEVLGHEPGRAVLPRIGAMLQNAGLPEHVSVRELVRLVGRSYPEALSADAVLAHAHLDDRADRTVTALSGGERQRLLLALALVGVPELLILDEPTAALDVASRRRFWERVHRSATDAGTTVVFATHDLAEATSVTDRVVVLQAGRIVADATPEELAGGDGLEEVFLRLTEEVSAAHPEGARR